jgi:uncharacterized repeat protein (TIGR02543 family)
MTKRILRAAISAFISFLFLVSCSMGLEPVWKAKDKTVVSLKFASLESASASSSGRALLQGTGYLYIRTIGTVSTGEGSLYGPYSAAAGQVFETTEIPEGVYAGIGFLFTTIQLDTKTYTYMGKSYGFRELMQLPDAEFNIFSDGENGESAFSQCINGEASGIMVNDVTILPGQTNSFDVTLEPITGLASEVDAAADPYFTYTSDMPNTLRKKFIRLENIGLSLPPGMMISELVCTMTASDPTTTVGYVALYDETGNLVMSIPPVGTMAGPAAFAAPYTSGNTFYVYFECKGTSLDFAFSATLVSAPATDYTVTFDINTGSGFMVPQTIAGGATVNLSLNTFTKAGYSFAGWGTSAGGPVQYSDGASYTMGAANVTLYAQWTTATLYTVSFNANGGAGALMMDQSIAGGTSVPLTMNTYTKMGYTFAGWATSAGGAVSYLDTAPYAMGAANATLYAQWTANTYTVSYDAQGGSPTPAAYTATYGLGYMTPPSASRGGYTFGGWWTGIGGTGINIVGGTLVTTASNHTLYAEWVPNTMYSITFDGFGADAGTMPMQSIPDGATEPLTTNAFTRTGYHFLGWGLVDALPVDYTDGASFTMGASSLTLYALWEGNSYTISYDAQGGTPTPSSYTATYGLGYMTPPGASWNGYTFGGWWTGPLGTGINVMGGGTMVTTASNHTLYAKWTDMTSPEAISFTVNGGLPYMASSETSCTFSVTESASGLKTLNFGGDVSGFSGVVILVDGIPQSVTTAYPMVTFDTPIVGTDMIVSVSGIATAGAEGVKSITCTVSDEAGNTSGILSGMVTLDMTGPLLVTPNSGGMAGPIATYFDVLCSDALSGLSVTALTASITAITYVADEATPSSLSYPGSLTVTSTGANTWQVTGLNILVATYRMYVKLVCTDNAGNQSIFYVRQYMVDGTNTDFRSVNP